MRVPFLFYISGLSMLSPALTMHRRDRHSALLHASAAELAAGDALIEVIISLGEAGLRSRRYRSVALMEALRHVEQGLIERGYTAAQLAPLRNYILRLGFH